MAEVCRMLLDPGLPDGDLRKRVPAVIGHDELAQPLNEVRDLVRLPDDALYIGTKARKTMCHGSCRRLRSASNAFRSLSDLS